MVQKSRRLLVVLVTSSLLLTGFASLAIASLSSKLTQAETDQLAQWSRQYLQDRADTYVHGTAAQSPKLTEVPTAPALEQKFKAEAAKLDERRQQLLAAGGGYKAAETSVEVKKMEGDANTAMLTVHERTKLYFVHTEGVISLGREPVTASEYTLDHTLTFTRQAASWQLEAVKAHLSNPQTAPETQTVDQPVSHRPSSGEVKVEGMQSLPSIHDPRDLKKYKWRSESSKLSVVPSLQSYNYQAMWDYAQLYWSSYNTARYRTYTDNDCTNFISQIMVAGGWAYEGTWTWERQDPSKWFYGDYTWTTSYSWAAAHNWAVYSVNYSGRTYLLSDWSYVSPTDVIQVDWNKADGSSGPDGTIDHTMFVSEIRVVNGTLEDILLTYHSNNQYRKSIAELFQTHPNAEWYLHRT